MAATRRGFTLMELLVVVSIIVILTALSIPAISKFLGGEGLRRGGQIVRSAINDARRAAITQRDANYLILFRRTDDARPGEYVYGLRRYRDGVGYEGDTHLLPNGIMFYMNFTTSLDGCAGRALGMNIPVFEGLPDEEDATWFGGAAKTYAAGQVGLRFLPDGSLELFGTGTSEQGPPAVGSEEMFDPDANLEAVPQATFDALPGLTDLSLMEAQLVSGGLPDAVDKRCFIDINMLTGLTQSRVLQTTGG